MLAIVARVRDDQENSIKTRNYLSVISFVKERDVWGLMITEKK